MEQQGEQQHQQPLQIIGKDASVAPSTLERGVEPHQPRKEPRKRAPKQPTDVKLDLRKHSPAVAAVARSLAEGDIRRIEEIGIDVLVVHNHPRWKRSKPTTDGEN